jgi:hypothetical protein
MRKVITAVGTGSIQNYVFGTNRLREDVGASLLVDDATKWWTRQGRFEILFSGGGNAGILFDDIGKAQAAVWQWSRHFLEFAPGLRLTAVHVEYEEGGLAEAYLKAGRKLEQAEDAPPFGAPLGAIPFSRMCGSTGGAASDRRYQERWMSDEALAKWAREKKRPFDLSPNELEDLDRDGASHIAIVHADGDGIGKRFREIAEEGGRDIEFRGKLRRFSDDLEKVVEDTLNVIKNDLGKLRPALVEAGIIDNKPDQIPIRPLIEAGDDVTFIVPGRIGLATAVRYMQLFSEHAKTTLGKEFTSSAGILILSTKFPFSRAYSLVEQLAHSAKVARRERASKKSWLDFQIVLEGTTGDLDQVRESYEFSEYSLLRRPYELGSNAPNGWKTFETIWREFSDTEKWPRSHAKRLLETLARGSIETKRLLEEFASRGRHLPLSDLIDVWKPEREDDREILGTPYFDPLEALDHHVQIDWDKHSVIVREKAHAQAAH